MGLGGREAIIANPNDAPLRQRDESIITDDHVVMNAEIHQPSALAELAGKPDTPPARRGIPGWMIVNQNEMRRAGHNRASEDLSRVHQRSAQRAPRNLRHALQDVLSIQMEHAEDLLRLIYQV